MDTLESVVYLVSQVKVVIQEFRDLVVQAAIQELKEFRGTPEPRALAERVVTRVLVEYPASQELADILESLVTQAFLDTPELVDTPVSLVNLATRVSRASQEFLGIVERRE